jgi:DNA-binding transcriptional ArsR family regulator
MDDNLYLSRGICKLLGDRPAIVFAHMLERQADGFRLSENCNTGGQVIELQEHGYFPYSKVDLSGEVGVSVGTISRYIKKLIDAGLIQEIKRKGEPCFYRIVEREKWVGWLQEKRKQQDPISKLLSLIK